MSKITNDGLTRSDALAVPIWQQWASKGYVRPSSTLRSWRRHIAAAVCILTACEGSPAGSH